MEKVLLGDSGPNAVALPKTNPRALVSLPVMEEVIDLGDHRPEDGVEDDNPAS